MPADCKKIIIFAKIIRLLDSSIANVLQSLSLNVEKLAAQRDEALALLKQAREEISDLNQQLSVTKEDLHKRDLDVEFLTVSHKLADNPQALAEARNTVKGMLAKVEKAISLLKEDARI